uniref:Large ribosomal subunit protein bL33c n=1 Tax=Eosphagnum rigescens TaxID=1846180 RepID=A0A172N7T5_9BRYO|nr:ribosomal protein L33 [Eosphagnum rigescens]
MAKNKDVRITITLECTDCAQDSEKKKKGVSRYTTRKNRRNTPIRLELKKYCPFCGGHTIHKEIKK